MNFKDKWVDKVDGIDDVLADDVNTLADGIKEAIEKAEDAGKNADIKDLSITTKKIADGAVTLEKLADDAKIINNASGDNIALSDSAESNLRGMRMFGRTEHYTYGYQLFDANDLIGGNANLDGASLNVNKDGSFTITNNKSQNAHFSYSQYIAVKSIFKTGKALSLKVYGATNVEVTLGFSDLGDIGIDGTYISNRAGGRDSFEMTQTILDNAASLTVLMNGTLDSSASETIKIMLYQDGDGTWEQFTGGKPAPTTEFPCKLVSVGDDGSVDIQVSSGNLMTDWIVGAAGANTGAITTDKLARRTDYIPILSAMGNLIASNFNGKLNSYMSFFDKDKVYIERTTSTAVTKQYTAPIPTNAAYVILNMLQTSNSTGVIEADLPDVMLEYGTTPTAYKPYKPIQTLSVPTPNGLPAVPVTSGGNYTDASGQQWVCDEIDFDSGVYIKRVYTYEITGEEPWKLHSELTEGFYRYDTFIDKPINAGEFNKVDICMCTHYKHKANIHDGSEGCWITTTDKDGRPVVGIRIATTLPQIDDLTQVLKEQYALGNPVTIKYILAEPIETPLSEEEIAAYKALHTYKPNTSIHNSDNAHMAVDYVADTKNYVDNQIKKEVAELTAAILTQ